MINLNIFTAVYRNHELEAILDYKDRDVIYKFERTPEILRILKTTTDKDYVKFNVLGNRVSLLN